MKQRILSHRNKSSWWMGKYRKKCEREQRREKNMHCNLFLVVLMVGGFYRFYMNNSIKTKLILHIVLNEEWAMSHQDETHRKERRVEGWLSEQKIVPKCGVCTNIVTVCMSMFGRLFAFCKRKLFTNNRVCACRREPCKRSEGEWLLCVLVINDGINGNQAERKWDECWDFD